MKHIKRLLISTLFLCFTCFFSTVVAAENPKLSLSGATISPGNEVDLVLALENNPGIHQMKIKIPYDSSKLEVISVTKSNCFSSIDYNLNNNSSIDMIFSSSGSQNTTSNGLLCTIKLKVISGMAGDKCNLSILGEAVNVNEQQISFKYSNGYIKIPNYTVMYDANGGSGAPSRQTKISGQNLALSSTKPTRIGYNFLGWATTNDALSAQYSAGATYSNNENIKLYAVWKALEYTIKYDANGGSNEPPNQTKIYGESIILSNNEPIRAGYIFEGWTSNKNSINVEYMPGGMITDNANTTLYAVWASDYYFVKYDANGGTGTPGIQIKENGVDLKLSSVVPTKKGSLFLGWATSASSTVPQYNFESLYTSDSDITLYAVWNDISRDEYTISYNDGINIPSKNVYSDGTIINISDVISERSGYEFVGWCLEKDSDVADFFPGNEYYVNEDATFYAMWKEKDIHSGDEDVNLSYGDVDNDKLLTATDAACVLKKVLNMDFKLPIEEITSDYMQFADVDNNGILTASDAAIILQKVLNKDFVFPIEK